MPSRSLTSFQSPARVSDSSISSARPATWVRDSLSPARTLSPIVIAGNGFGFWNTIPIRRRMSVMRSSER